MTTSYILDQQRDLKAHKAMMRAAEKTSDDNRAAEKEETEEVVYSPQSTVNSLQLNYLLLGKHSIFILLF